MPPNSRFKDFITGLRSTPGGETLSVSQLIQMKLKQITSGNIDTVGPDESAQPSPENVDVQSSTEFVMSTLPSGELVFIFVPFCNSICLHIPKARFPLGEFVRANRQKSRNASYLFAANFFASQF